MRQHINALNSLGRNVADDNRVFRENLKKKKRLQTAGRRKAQSSIFYLRMIEDGICEIEDGLYSKTITFDDINYQTARSVDQVAIFRQYCEFINYFDPSVHIQITVANQTIDKDEFRLKILYPLIGDKSDRYRKEINGILSGRALEGQNSLIRRKYLTFTVEAGDYSQAQQKLLRLESDIIINFKQLSGNNISIRALSGHERLELLYSIISPGEIFTFRYDNLVLNGLSTKDYITPDYFDFSEKNYFEMDDTVSSTLYIKDFPSELGDQLIRQISDIDCNLTINIHFTGIEQTDAVELVQRKLALMNQQKADETKRAIKGLYDTDYMPPELKYSITEAESLLEDLRNRNQRMYKVTVLINTSAKTLEALTDNVAKIMGVIRKNGCKGGFLSLEQEAGFNSSLPIGSCFVNRARTMTTTSTAIFVPFTTQEIMHDNGVCYGTNPLSGNLIMVDRKILPNANGWMLGIPGSGKSMMAKGEQIHVMLRKDIEKTAGDLIRPGDDIIVIDPEAEYTELIKAFDGEVVKISADSRDYINPFDITDAYSDDEAGRQNPIAMKSEFLLSLCELIISRNAGRIDSREISILDRVIGLTYRPYFLSKPAARTLPTFRDFFRILKEQPEPEAKQLTLALELYTEGSLSLFSHHTTINTASQFLDFDISGLGGQLQTLGMLVVLDQIWNRITLNRGLGKRTWIYVDEIYLLFQNEYSSAFLKSLFKRARKWGAIITGITQNVEELLMSDDARTMLSNSEFICMLSQAKPDREQLSSLLNLSPEQISYVTNSGPGQGIIYCSGAVVPFVNRYPENTELHKLMTTKIEDINSYSG